MKRPKPRPSRFGRKPGKLRKPKQIPVPSLNVLTDLIVGMLFTAALEGTSVPEKMLVAALIPRLLVLLREGNQAKLKKLMNLLPKFPERPPKEKGTK